MATVINNSTPANQSTAITLSISVFNPLTFSSSSVNASSESTGSLTVSSQASTSGITDSQTVSCQNINIADTATFSGTPIAGSNSLATTSYVDTSINNLLGANVPTLLQTIQEIDTAINNDPNFATTITTQLSSKSGLSSNNTFTGNNTFSQITLGASDLNTRITTDESNITTNTNNITSNTANIASLQTKSTNQTYSNNVTSFSGSIATPTILLNGTDINSRLTTDETNITNIQTSLTSLAPKANPIFTGTTTTASLIDNGSLTVSNGITMSGNLTVNSGGEIITPTLLLNGTNLNTRLTTDETNITNIQTSLTSLAPKSNPIFSGTTTTASLIDNGSLTVSNGITMSGNLTINSGGEIITPTLFLNGTNLNTRLTTDETNITTNTNAITANTSNISTNTANIATNTSAISGNTTNISTNTSNIASNTTNIATNTANISTLQTQMTAKAIDSAVVHNTGNENIAGVKTFTSSPIVPTTSINNNSTNCASTAYVDTAINNLINGAPNTLNTLNQIATLLQTDTNNITAITNAMVDNSSNQTIGGIKTFTLSPQVPTKSQADNSTNAASTSYVDTGLATNATNIATNTSNITALQTQNTNQSYSGGVTTFSGTLATPAISLNGVNLATTLSGKQATLTFDSVPTSSSTNPVTSGGTYTALQNYIPISGNTTVSNNLILSGNCQYSGESIVADLIELISTATVTSNAVSVSYTGNNAIFYITPSSAANISLTITNVPTSYSNCSVNLTFIINAATYKQYINSISVNSSSYTMIASGGLANISVNSSSVYIVQNFNIIFLSGSITKVLTNVNYWY